MTLNLDWSNVKDYKELEKDDDWRKEIVLLGHLMMPMGVRAITASNVGEVFARIDILQRLQGAFMHRSDGKGGREPVLFTPEDIISYIGLRTNVPDISRTEFMRNVVRSHMDEQARAASGSHQREALARFGAAQSA